MGETKQKPQKVTSIEHLQELCLSGKEDYFIWFGVARSSKTIRYYPEDGTFWVFNEIDGTDETWNPEDFMKYTSSGTAINKGSFYVELN